MISVVIISRNEGTQLADTVDSLRATLSDQDEIIIVDDQSDDGSPDFVAQQELSNVRVIRTHERLGAIKARNYGAAYAIGDVLVFSDAHIRVPNQWLDMVTAVSDPSVGMVGPCLVSEEGGKGYGLRYKSWSLDWEWLPNTGEHLIDVPILAVCFVAIKRDLFNRIGGFDIGIEMYGREDPEICQRLWSYGYRCAVLPPVEVVHYGKPVIPDYMKDYETVLHNTLWLAGVHFKPKRIAKVISVVRGSAEFPMALGRLLTQPLAKARENVQSRRTYDDDWYFGKFDMDTRCDYEDGIGDSR